MRLIPSRSRLQYLLHKLHTGFWFVPVCFTVAAPLAASLSLWADENWAADTLAGIGTPFSMRLETARQLLATLAGAVVTVVGLVFSLTLVALTLAAGNLGPRLLDRYMGNRVTQITMGLFAGTFVFVVVTLSGLELVDDRVPHLTVSLATLLTVACVVWLSFAFHNLATTLQVDEEAAAVAKALNAAISDLSEPDAGWEEDPTGPRADPDPAPDAGHHPGVVVAMRAVGYVQSIDHARLCAIAARHDCLVTLAVRPGDHVIPTDHAAYVRGGDETGAIAALEWELSEIVAVGAKRTETDDLLFNLHLLLEIAARALSPGVNDHYTALGCVDHITGCVAHGLRTGLVRRCWCDETGTLRLRTRSADIVDLVETAFTSLRHAAAGHPLVLLRCIRGIERLASAPADARATAALIDQVELLERAGMERAAFDRDREEIAAAARAALASLRRAEPDRPRRGPGATAS